MSWKTCRQMNSVSDAKLFRPDGKRERLLSWLPQYHDYGLIGVFLFHGIYAGAELNLMSPFTFIQKPLLWMEKVSELRITATASPNFGFALALKKSKESQASGVMLKLDLSSLRFLSCGAEPIQAPMISDFMAFFNGHGLGTVFSPCYGLAEHVLGATSAFPGVDMKVQDNRVSCGTPLPGVTLRIVDHESLREVPDGETGEIWIDGDSKSGGYWNNPELTSETFHAELEACPGKKFLRTGDLGFLKDGEIYVSGRLKDVVIVQGRNFFANDIEHAALVSQGKMLRPGSIAAFSVDSKDPSSPEHLVIVVEVKDSLMKASAQTLLEVAAGITKDVSTIMGISPSFVVLVKPKSVPKTTSGKIMRRATRELYQENKLASVYTFPQHISVTGNASKSKTGIIQKMRSFFQTTSSPIKRNDSAVNFVSQNPGDSDASVTFISQVEMCSIEKQVASVWSNVLGIPTTSISSDSDFFALGGTSMQAIMVLNKLNQDYSPGFEGITILMFAARPTVSGLADLWTVAPMSRVAESALTKEEALKEYFDEIESLDDMIINADGAAVPFDISRIAGNSSTILLTGANGFVGSGIYYSFKKHNSSVRVICHVRAKTKELGAIRVKEAVAFYHGEWNAAWPEPEVVVGDIAEPQLGVSVDDWEFLATAVDLIIHNAAKVDFVLPYQSLRKTNVVSTVEVLRLASVTKVKGVVFMSSASAVQPKSSAFANGTPEDVALENLAGDFFFGYGQTKNISEVLCQKARTRGIPTVSIRVGFVGGSSQTFVTNYDMTWDFIKTMKEKQISLIDNSFIQITPVDFLADSITALCLTPEFWGKPCVHLCPAIETCISWTQLSRLLKLSDSRNRSMPADVFTTIMMRECKDPRSPLFPFSEAIEAMAVTKFKQSWLVPSDILNQSQRIPNATDLWVGYLTHFFSSMETPDTTSKNLPIQTPL
ncbi:hypothetical protein BDR26DRAFT_522543 [Obelidium mucronatum]|nr:hypothetical protein BDR26DRAFT_522543 [Obelidium mucronatum]